MTRGGSKQRQIGERRCIISGETSDRAAMIRFVLSPDGVVTPDIQARLPGRGVWLSAQAPLLKQALDKKAFARAFKTQVTTPENLSAQIESQLLDRVISLISLARKAGEAIAGTVKVTNALEKGQVEILFQASDGSEREKRNLPYRKEVEIYFETLNRSELGMAFSRDNVVNAALTGGGLTRHVYQEAIRLSEFRGITYQKPAYDEEYDEEEAHLDEAVSAKPQ